MQPLNDEGEAPPLNPEWEPEGSPPRPVPRDRSRLLDDARPVPVTPPRQAVPTPILRPPTHGTPQRPPLVELREESPIVRGNRRVIFDDDPVVRRLPYEFDAEFEQNDPQFPEIEPRPPINPHNHVVQYANVAQILNLEAKSGQTTKKDALPPRKYEWEL